MIIERGIHPFDYGWIDDRTGNYLREVYDFMRYWNLIKDLPSTYTGNVDVSRVKEMMNVDARKMGFEHYEHALKHITPMVPYQVRRLCEYCRLFADVGTLWKLKPMLYVYWS